MDRALYDCRLRAAKRDRKLSGQIYCVGLALRFFSNGGGACWPSMRALADHAGCSVSTVQRAILRLRELGLLSWRPRYGSRHRRQTHLYQLENLARGSSVVVTGREPRRAAPMSAGLEAALAGLAARANFEGWGANPSQKLANLGGATGV